MNGVVEMNNERMILTLESLRMEMLGSLGRYGRSQIW